MQTELIGGYIKDYASFNFSNKSENKNSELSHKIQQPSSLWNIHYN